MASFWVAVWPTCPGWMWRVVGWPWLTAASRSSLIWIGCLSPKAASSLLLAG